jgi:hypothetical protein
MVDRINIKMPERSKEGGQKGKFAKAAPYGRFLRGQAAGSYKEGAR